VNREFLLPAEPAVARRLLLLHQFGLIDLPAGLAKLAEQDRIPKSAFDQIICPHTPEREMIMQFLIDNNMRGIVQAAYHPGIDETTMLNIARVSSIGKVSVISRRTKTWRSAAKAWFLPDFDIMYPHIDHNERWIDARRDGILIIDLDTDDDYQYICKPLIREFPHAILYQSSNIPIADCVHWSLLANLLFPTMHAVSLIRTNGPPHWAKKHLNDFALFYNMCLFPRL
jgi:hypothetical protein